MKLDKYDPATDAVPIPAWNRTVALCAPRAHEVYRWLRSHGDDGDDEYITRIDSMVELVALCVVEDGKQVLRNDDGRENIHQLHLRHAEQFALLLDACSRISGVGRAKKDTASKKKRKRTGRNGRMNTLSTAE